MSSNLPYTHSGFTKRHLVDVDLNSDPKLPDECFICLEKLDNLVHPAVQVTNIPECSHVFGRRCLLTWIISHNENQNKCPMCRTRLFGRERRRREDTSQPDFISLAATTARVRERIQRRRRVEESQPDGPASRPMAVRRSGGLPPAELRHRHTRQPDRRLASGAQEDDIVHTQLSWDTPETDRPFLDRSTSEFRLQRPRRLEQRLTIPELQDNGSEQAQVVPDTADAPFQRGIRSQESGAEHTQLDESFFAMTPLTSRFVEPETRLPQVQEPRTRTHAILRGELGRAARPISLRDASEAPIPGPQAPPQPSVRSNERARPRLAQGGGLDLARFREQDRQPFRSFGGPLSEHSQQQLVQRGGLRGDEQAAPPSNPFPNLSWAPGASEKQPSSLSGLDGSEQTRPSLTRFSSDFEQAAAADPIQGPTGGPQPQEEQVSLPNELDELEEIRLPSDQSGTQSRDSDNDAPRFSDFSEFPPLPVIEVLGSRRPYTEFHPTRAVFGATQPPQDPFRMNTLSHPEYGFNAYEEALREYRRQRHQPTQSWLASRPEQHPNISWTPSLRGSRPKKPDDPEQRSNASEAPLPGLGQTRPQVAESQQEPSEQIWPPDYVSDPIIPELRFLMKRRPDEEDQLGPDAGFPYSNFSYIKIRGVLYIAGEVGAL